MAVNVSVVVPCYNEERYIGQCIDSFFRDIAPIKIEVLIIDGMSTDNTREEIATKQNIYPGQVQVIDNPRKKTPFALNLGIESASGEYLLIASAHSSFDPGYIKKIIDCFETTEAAVIGGSMETKVLHESPKSLSIMRVLSNKFGVGNSMFRVGIKNPTFVDTVPFGIYKTEMLKALGGYDTRLIRNHDIELSKRILEKGHKILLVPEPKCYYYARETFSGLFQNNFRNGNWNLKTVYITRKFSSLSLRHFIPLLFLLSIVLPLLASIFFTPFAFLSLLSLAAYFIVILSQSIKIKSLSPSASIPYTLFAFFTLHVSYGLGSLLGLLSLNYLRR